MRSLQWLLCVMYLVQYVTSQITLVESGPGTVKPAGTMDLVCKVTGASLTDSTNMYCVDWIRDDGRKLEWLGRICYNGATAYASSLQGRLTLTRDINKGEVYCKVTGMKPEESGTYYCARDHHYIVGTGLDIWGPGTPLTVTAVTEPIAPRVYPLIPYGQHGNTNTTAGCLISKYFPMPVTVAWSTTIGESVSGVKNIQFPLNGNPPTYSLVSLLTLSSSDWENKSYHCNVLHFSSSFQKTIPKGCLPPPDAPTVELLQESCPDNTYGQIDLSCVASNLTSLDARIQWFINNKERSLPQEQVHMGKTSYYYSLQSRVSVSLSEWNTGAIVKCQVTDTKTGKSTAQTAKKCSDNYSCLEIKVIMVPPTIEDLYIGEIARIACLAHNLKEPTGSTFQWTSPEDLNQTDTQTEDPQLHQNGTYSVASIITVSPEAWLQYMEFTCVFSMPGLSEPIIRRISRRRETRRLPPIVALYPPSPEAISNKEMCNLACFAYGFIPKDVFMGWTENKMEISKDQYVTSEPKLSGENGNQSYFMSSVLQIPCSKWEGGTSFTCLVGHEANPLIFTRKTIDKHSGKPSKVNVSINMCDTTLSCF